MKAYFLVIYADKVNLIFLRNLTTNMEVKHGMSREYEDIDNKFQQVGQLIQEGKIEEANPIIELLQNKKDISPYHRLKCTLLTSQIKIKTKIFQEGLKLAENVKEKSHKAGIPLLEIDACIEISKALEGLGNYDESLDVIDRATSILKISEIEPPTAITRRMATLFYLKGRYYLAMDDLAQAMTFSQQSLTLRENLGDKQLISESLTSIGRIYSIKGTNDKALEFFKKSLTLLQQVGNDHDIAWSFWNIGSIYCHTGHVNQSLEYFKSSKTYFEKVGDKIGNGQALYCLSAMTHDKGELDQALEYQRQSLGFYKELGNKSEIAKSLAKIGFISLSKGELDRALEFLHQSQDIGVDIKDHQKAWTLVGIGEVYRLKGELDRALTYLEESLALRKEANHEEDIAECLYYIGKIFHQQGKLDAARKYLEESLDLLNAPGHNFLTTGILLDLISLVIEEKYHEQVDEYLQRLKTINDQEENLIINQRYRMAKALVLKTSSRIKDKALVQEYFQQIAGEEIADHRITVDAMYNLCESLLDELRAYGEDEVLLQAKALAHQLTELAHKQFSSPLAINALILQAKLAMVEGNLSDAEGFLDQAKTIAEEKNLGTYIIAKVSTERRNLEDQYEAWQELIRDNASFKDRLEQAQIRTYLNEALRLARAGKDHKICK